MMLINPYIFGGSSPSASFDDLLMTFSPMVFWKLEDTIINGSTTADSSGNGLIGSYAVPLGDLVLQPGSSIVTGATKSYAKSGIDDAGASRGTGISISGSYTVGAWVSLDTTSNLFPTIANMDDAQRLFQFRTNGGKMEFANIQGGGAILGSTNFMNTGRHFCVGVLDVVAGTITVYLDGVSDGSASGSFGAGASSQLYVGCYRISGQPDYEWKGLLSRFFLINSALTATDIANLWAAGE